MSDDYEEHNMRVLLEWAGETPEQIRAERDALAAQLAAARELLEDVWQQFAIPGKDGQLWAGGLSTLEAVDKLLHPEPYRD